MEFALTEHLTFLEYIPVAVKSMQKCASSPELHTWPSEKPSSISLWGRQETESTTCSSRHHTWGRQVSASSQCLTQSDLELPGDSKKLYNSHANQLDLQMFDPDMPEIPCTSGSEGVRGQLVQLFTSREIANRVHGFGGRAAALEERPVSIATYALEVPCRRRSDRIANSLRRYEWRRYHAHHRHLIDAEVAGCLSARNIL